MPPRSISLNCKVSLLPTTIRPGELLAGGQPPSGRAARRWSARRFTGRGPNSRHQGEGHSDGQGSVVGQDHLEATLVVRTTVSQPARHQCGGEVRTYHCDVPLPDEWIRRREEASPYAGNRLRRHTFSQDAHEGGPGYEVGVTCTGCRGEEGRVLEGGEDDG